MDKENVITPTGDLKELDIDMANWQSMSYDQRKRSDESCIQKYGRSNTDLYELIKKNILLANDKIVSEGLEHEPTEVDKNEYGKIMEKLKMSAQLQSDNGIILINQWMFDNEPDYGIEELDAKYNSFLALPDDLKRYSNEASVNLWGYDVHNMYHIMKNKLLTYLAKVNDTGDVLSMSLTDKQLSEFGEQLSNINDPLQLKVRELDCVSYNGSLYENTIIDSFYDGLKESENNAVDFSSDIPRVTPWFTPDEMLEMFGIEVNPYDYVLQGNNSDKLHQDIRKEMYTLNSGNLYKTDTEKQKKKIIKLGWNPSVPYNEETMAYARQRQIKWFNENKRVQIIDISSYNVLEEADDGIVKKALVKLEPIYITLLRHDGITSKVIRGWTKASYSHAGISFNEKLDKIYSFNANGVDGKTGFNLENLKFYSGYRNPGLKVLVFFVTPEVKKSLHKTVEYYIKNRDKTKYAFDNIVNIVLNKAKDTQYSLNMVCSQFVDFVLKSAKLDITGKPSNLVAPGDFDRSSDTRIFSVFDGKIPDYNSSKVKKYVSSLISRVVNPDDIVIKPMIEALESIFKERLLEGFFVETGNDKADEILSEIRELLTPTVISEAKPLPVRFGKSGNLFVDLPRDLESEYQEAHRLLTSYDESNVQGIKHQLARLFYINSIIENKIRKMKNKDDSYKDLVDLRARVINDFKTYMKVVQKIEDNFDFEEYMKNSEYYNKTVVIDKHTMKYTGKVIIDMIKIMK